MRSKVGRGAVRRWDHGKNVMGTGWGWIETSASRAGWDYGMGTEHTSRMYGSDVRVVCIRAFNLVLVSLSTAQYAAHTVPSIPSYCDITSDVDVENVKPQSLGTA